jgi:asparagine synthase (glutamine-hydrolysing)
MTYIALVWNAAIAEESASAHRFASNIREVLPEYQQVFKGPGLYVATLKTRPGDHFESVQLAKGGGVILGRIFERISTKTADAVHRASKIAVDEATSARILADGGVTLRDRFWGGYVALLNGPSSTHWVIRDPTGAIPCQHTVTDDIHIYFDRIADLFAFVKRPFSVNKHFLIGSLTVAGQYSSETGYEGISTILAGERIEHKLDRVRKEFLWNPLTLANEDDREDVVEIASDLHKTVRSCIHAWASCFDSLAVHLSGGLDSAILAACLSNAPTTPKVVCLNYFHDRGTSDERKFARDVARHNDFELLELPEEGVGRLDLTVPSEPTAVPRLNVIHFDRRLQTFRLQGDRGIRAVFLGAGGDELFHRASIFPDAADFAFMHGLALKLFAVALNDAIIDHKSIWYVIRRSVELGILRQTFGWCDIASPLRLRFVARGLFEAASQDATHLHPLLRDRIKSPPGKLFQVAKLLPYFSNYYAPKREFAPPAVPLSPLLSQPVIELALKIPVFALRAGARDRGLARLAFSESIPATVLDRQYKSISTTPCRAWVAEDIETVRELLLGGYLAREKILNVEGLESAFVRDEISDARSTELTLYICAELWARGAEAAGKAAKFAA